jgi:hypothetical protein
LNQSGYVDEETGRRISSAVEETGYTPSIAASSLKSQKSRLLMLVVPDICNPFYSQIARRVQQLARDRGYVMALLNSNGSPEEETAAVRTAVQMYAGGILLTTIDVRPNVVKTIVDSGIPAVGLNAFEESEFDTVHVHKNGGTYLAVRHLLELGHTGIAFAGGLPGTAIAQSRRLGYERALHEAGLLWSEVLRLARVGGQVVKLRLRAIHFDQQLPVAVAYGQVGKRRLRRAGTVRRPLPEQRLRPRGGAPAGQRQAQVLAVQCRAGGGLGAGKGQHRWQKVHRREDAG